MPPKVAAISPPTDGGRSARDFLDAHGYVAQTPTIRSSDFELGIRDPFRYYLRRRLGLVEALRYSEALSRGSWFHFCLEKLDYSAKDRRLLVDSRLATRQDELKDSAALYHLSPTELQAWQDTEREDALCALAWFEAFCTVPIPGESDTFPHFLSRPYWRLLGHEVRCIYTKPRWGTTPLVAQLDLLLYHRDQNSIWVVDAKTCGGSTISRLSLCPYEYQTLHYLYIAQQLLALGVIQNAYNLPSDTHLGGMLHVALQKPTITFGLSDRDYTITQHTLQRGPRKGQTDIRRTYQGEPSLSNYTDRCRQWFLRQGDYQDAQQKYGPALNLSTTYASSLRDPHLLAQYTDALDYIRRLAKMRPHPKNFPRPISHLLQFGKLDPLHPLYFNSPELWPDIIPQLRLMQTWRDDHLIPQSDSDYLASIGDPT